MDAPARELAPLTAPPVEAPAAPPSVEERGSQTLLVQFGDFAAELLRLKYALAADRLGGAEGLTPAELAGMVHQRLRTLLEAQTVRARHWGGAYGEGLYREAQYAMAALADETMLLRIQWDGKAAWQDRLLETALFGTRIAGERFYERLDALLEEGTRTSGELATIYLVALALGFRGRYWRPEDEVRLREYRTALSRVIARDDPELARNAAHLFPQAYDHTIDQGRAVRLPHLRPWMLALAAVVLVFLGASHLVWVSATAEVERSVQRIENLLSHPQR